MLTPALSHHTASSATVRGIIFNLQTNGPPGFLRPYTTDDNRKANLSFFYPDHRGETIMLAVEAAGFKVEKEIDLAIWTLPVGMGRGTGPNTASSDPVGKSVAAYVPRTRSA